MKASTTNQFERLLVMIQAHRFCVSAGTFLILLVLTGLPSPLLGQVVGLPLSQPREEEPKELPERGVMLLPAPTYPLDGDVNQLDLHFPDQFVFFDSKTIDPGTFDPATMDLILAYRTAPDVPRTIHRIKSPRLIAPEIVSTVSKTSLGGYRYRYVVTNGAKATQPIGIWLLSVPEPRAPDPTRSEVRALRHEGERGVWTRELYALREGTWSVRFSSPRSGLSLSSGQSADFVVDNENRPGFVRSYFHGTEPAVGPIPDDLPPRAREQLERITRNWTKAELWTIGPKYGEWKTSRDIAIDFRIQIPDMLPRRIRIASVVHPDRVRDMYSPFVRAVLDRLDEFIDRPRPWFTDTDEEMDDSARELYSRLAFDEPFPPIGESPDPASKFEQQLDLALRLALIRP